jgi:KaiC/GvpD/RAD55 family RecA-like ATPase
MPLFGRAKTDPPLAPPPPEVGFLSTGAPGLDQALGGGYRLGTVALLESSDIASRRDFRALTIAAMVEALRSGRGVLVVPVLEEPAREVVDTLAQSVDRRILDARLRVLDHLSAVSEAPWHVAVAGRRRDEVMRARILAEKATAGTPARPILEVNSMETMENLASFETAGRRFAYEFSRAKGGGHTMLVSIRASSPELGVMRQMSDLLLQLESRAGRLSVRGLRPEFLSVAWD